MHYIRLLIKHCFKRNKNNCLNEEIFVDLVLNLCSMVREPNKKIGCLIPILFLNKSQKLCYISYHTLLVQCSLPLLCLCVVQSVFLACSSIELMVANVKRRVSPFWVCAWIYKPCKLSLLLRSLTSLLKLFRVGLSFEIIRA